MALRRPLPCESAGIAGRRRAPADQPRRPPRPQGPQTANCPQMMTTGPTGSTAGDIPRGQVRSAPAGGIPRVRGPDSRPRRRRTSPPPRRHVPGRAGCPRTRGVHPPAPPTQPHPHQHEGPVAVGLSTNHNRPRVRTLNRPSAAAFRCQNAATTAPSGQVLLM